MCFDRKIESIIAGSDIRQLDRSTNAVLEIQHNIYKYTMQEIRDWRKTQRKRRRAAGFERRILNFHLLRHLTDISKNSQCKSSSVSSDTEDANFPAICTQFTLYYSVSEIF